MEEDKRIFIWSVTISDDSDWRMQEHALNILYFHLEEDAEIVMKFINHLPEECRCFSPCNCETFVPKTETEEHLFEKYGNEYIGCYASLSDILIEPPLPRPEKYTDWCVECNQTVTTNFCPDCGEKIEQ